MRQLAATSDFDAARAELPIFLAYFSTPQCSVCKALLPKVEALLDERDVPGLYVDTSALPEVSGQLLIFTAPTLLLFVHGQELARFSRHVQMREVEAALERGAEFASEGGGYER